MTEPQFDANVIGGSPPVPNTMGRAHQQFTRRGVRSGMPFQYQTVCQKKLVLKSGGKPVLIIFCIMSEPQFDVIGRSPPPIYRGTTAKFKGYATHQQFTRGCVRFQCAFNVRLCVTKTVVGNLSTDCAFMFGP